MELLVLPTRHSAQKAGFRANRRHPRLPELIYCVLDGDVVLEVEMLRGYRFDRIMIDSSCMRSLTAHQWYAFRGVLEAYCSRPDTVWIEP